LGAQPSTDCLIPKVDLFVDAHEEALDTLLTETARHPDYADVKHRLGLLYDLAGEPERAIEYHLAALSINPAYRAAHSALGYAREAAGDREGAMAAWQQGVEQGGGSDHPGTLLDLAMAAGRRGAPEEGLELLERLPVEQHASDLVTREHALLLLQAGQLQEGEDRLMALRVRSPYYRAYFGAQGLTENGRLVPERIGDFLAEREPNHNLAEILTYLSETYAAFQAYTKAEAELQAALETGFDLPAFHVRLGRLRRLAGEISIAATEFQQAIELDPQHVGARIELGYELAELGDATGALEQFQIVTRLAPGYADVHYQIGQLLLEQDELERSRTAFERALAVNPDYALAHASLALAHLRGGDDQQALESFERALACGLHSPDIYLNMARVHIGRGEPDRALEYLRKGAEIGPTYAPLYYHLGRLYREMGHRDDAHEAWRLFFAYADELEFSDRLELFREDLRSQLVTPEG
jgi:tetratricopeptide (TPR) repeat protein